jgi:ornithine decarboxylase
MHKLASYLIQKHGLHDSFYIVSLRKLDETISIWKRLLPNIQPFYAMKCNPDEVIMRHMIKHGFGFDCASQIELSTVLDLGCDVNDIIFAHPVKKTHDLRYALKRNLSYVTFDSMSELDKIKHNAEAMKCILRLRVDNPSARIQLGLKYGVGGNEHRQLISYAKELRLNVVGTSFHVGSASKDPIVFKKAIEYSREVFEYAREKGYMHMNVLDVGGGFTKETFSESAQVLQGAIQDNFNQNELKNMRIIAEPGRFFAEEAYTLFTPILGHKKQGDKMAYFISESLYGSFNCMLYDKQQPNYQVLRNPCMDSVENLDEEMYPSIVYGNTCDSADKIEESIMLPRLRVGDFIQVNNFGAYTLSGAKNFNGINFTQPRLFYVES